MIFLLDIYSETFTIFSGGLSIERDGKSPCITVLQGRSTTVLEMEHPVVDFITICESPWTSGEFYLLKSLALHCTVWLHHAVHARYVMYTGFCGFCYYEHRQTATHFALQILKFIYSFYMETNVIYSFVSSFYVAAAAAAVTHGFFVIIKLILNELWTCSPIYRKNQQHQTMMSTTNTKNNRYARTLCNSRTFTK